MKNFWLTVLSIVTAAAIGTDAAMIYQFGERLARVEVKLELLAPQNHIAKTP